MAEDFQERTEQPTPKRLEEAKQKGDVAKSIEVNSAFSLLVSLLMLYVLGGLLFRQFALTFRNILGGGYMIDLHPADIRFYLIQGLGKFGIIVGLFMLVVMLTGLASSYMQVGVIFTLETITPKFNKLNPLKGLKKIIFSRRSLEELIKNVFKLTIIIIVAYNAIMGYKDEFIPLMDKEGGQILSFMLGAGLKVSFKIGFIFLVIAAADYIFQKQEHKKNLRMTKQEIKDEAKQTEGDPQIKSRIRSLQIQMARNRMMQAVPEADVVITNPTHYAIALKYQPENDQAPKVVAKGQNYIALRIKELAQENDVPIVEDPPLAQALYKTVEIDREIPARFFQAVAEVLAYVYKMKNKTLN